MSCGGALQARPVGLGAIEWMDEVSLPRLHAANEPQTLNDVYVNVNLESAGCRLGVGLR